MQYQQLKQLIIFHFFVYNTVGKETKAHDMFDFCGIGNACMDLVANVDDEFLVRHGFPKSICTNISLEHAVELKRDIPAPHLYIPGGCAANSAACIAALGGKAACTGNIANDETGRKFMEDMKTRNIHFAATMDPQSNLGSALIFCLTTPDTERTFAAYRGVQMNFSPGDIDAPLIKDSRVLHFDGYILNSPKGLEGFLHAASIAHENGTIISFCPSDIMVLDEFAAEVEQLMDIADVFICNEQEAMHMTGTQNMDDAFSIISSRIQKGAITLGAKGAIVFEDGQRHHVAAATPPAPVIDTNGAGDHFIGGFLYGLSHGYDIIKSGRLGNLCAATVITHQGTRPVRSYASLLETL